MKAQTQRLTRTLENTGFGTNIVDTIINASSAFQKFTMPTSFGLGYYFQFQRKFGIGFDYRKQLWGNYAAFFSNQTKLTNRVDYGVGVTIFPEDEKDPSQKRMKPPIRFGGRYSITQNVFTSNNQQVNILEQNVYLGFGIPITRRYFDSRVLRSVLNVQIDYLQRGKNITGLAKEQYIMLTLGLNLGDVWFQRTKFD
jgi:hypothetical protein